MQEEIDSIEIESIEQVGGEKEVYDLKIYILEVEKDIPNNHNFILGNDLLSLNSGKSTLAAQIAKSVDNTFTEDRMCLTPNEFTKKVNECNKQAIVYDEAFTGLASRRAMTQVNNLMVEMMMEMRKQNLFIILCLPSVFYLEKYVGLHRARGLLHCHLQKGKPGFYNIYNQQQLKLLYLTGKQKMSYAFPKTSIRGKFFHKAPIDWEEYEGRKIKALKLKGEKGTMAQKWMGQRAALIALMYEEGRNQQHIANYLKEHGFDVDRATISKVLIKHKKKFKKSDE